MDAPDRLVAIRKNSENLLKAVLLTKPLDCMVLFCIVFECTVCEFAALYRCGVRNTKSKLHIEDGYQRCKPIEFWVVCSPRVMDKLLQHLL